ncbi:uncharacterized protein L203_100342 [Cryptococcus depauperatus CBS 7841]|uniref:Uncharacterized protein n=1 Tax=Cryptococcus depauperatus CBS 7841 TaxID=1295531 RepID=A0AAJ8JMV8_9TREE|nr:hypothetical protein L204_02172 [Cryptococcus depauperatus CBS 7855]
MTLVYLHLESVWEGTNTLEQGTIEFWLSTVVGTQIRTMALTLIKEFGTEGNLPTVDNTPILSITIAIA